MHKDPDTNTVGTCGFQKVWTMHRRFSLTFKVWSKSKAGDYAIHVTSRAHGVIRIERGKYIVSFLRDHLAVQSCPMMVIWPDQIGITQIIQIREMVFTFLPVIHVKPLGSISVHVHKSLVYMYARTITGAIKWSYSCIAQPKLLMDEEPQECFL